MPVPKRMKAAILEAQRKPLAVGEVELPERLEPGQVLVRVRYSGICGSQLGEIDGVKGADKYLPHLLGHEGSGTVAETGPGVRHVKPGDTVVLHWRKGPGIDAVPPAYRWQGRPLNAGQVTTFNEYAVVSENRLTPIPADTGLEVATLFGCAVTTGFGVVVNDAKVGIGESVVIYGAGGVGLSMVQAAALVSADPIVAVDRFDNRLELARRLGATHTVNTASGDAHAAIREAVGADGPDVFIDNTGDPKVIELGYGLTPAEGRVILVGVPESTRDIAIHSLPLHFGKVLQGSHGGGTRPERDIPRYRRLHARGKLPLEALITARFPLDKINEAIAAMRSGEVQGRCVIAMPD